MIRKLSCPRRGLCNTNISSDDEHCVIFSHAVGEVISHDPEDQLEHLKISMRPDRVIGLNVTRRLQEYLLLTKSDVAYLPLVNRRILLPFMLIEAKKETDVPGFRSIETQTAFPLRRLLKVQDELKSACALQVDPPLVWFFANQGEEWRLYAGVTQESQVVSWLSCKISCRRNESDRLIELRIACVRPMAWHNRVSGWCLAVITNHGLHLDVGSRYISPPNQKMPPRPHSR
jgi:hypothetical protein